MKRRERGYLRRRKRGAVNSEVVDSAVEDELEGQARADHHLAADRLLDVADRAREGLEQAVAAVEAERGAVQRHGHELPARAGREELRGRGLRREALGGAQPVEKGQLGAGGVRGQAYRLRPRAELEDSPVGDEAGVPVDPGGEGKLAAAAADFGLIWGNYWWSG